MGGLENAKVSTFSVTYFTLHCTHLECHVVDVRRDMVD